MLRVLEEILIISRPTLDINRIRLFQILLCLLLALFHYTSDHFFMPSLILIYLCRTWKQNTDLGAPFGLTHKHIFKFFDIFHPSANLLKFIYKFQLETRVSWQGGLNVKLHSTLVVWVVKFQMRRSRWQLPKKKTGINHLLCQRFQGRWPPKTVVGYIYRV